MKKTKECVPAYLSRKFQVLSFVAMIAVVVSHAYNYTDSYLQPMTRITEGLHLPTMIEYFVANGLTRFAVPIFFLTSGYLFFAGVQEFKPTDYLNKIKSRVISLVVPYVFWLLFWSFMGLLMIALFQGARLPILQEKFAGWADSPIECMIQRPLPFQFWFLKDLMKLALFSPLFYFLVIRLKGYALLLFVIPWLLDISFSILPSANGMMFFAVGVWAALCGKDRFPIDKPARSKALLLLPVLWLLGCVGYTFVCASPSFSFVPELLLTITNKLCMAMGVVSVFVLYDFLHDKDVTAKQSRILSSTFVIFLLHEPLQHFVSQSIFLQNRSDAVHLILFFGLPAIFILLSILISDFLSRFLPGFRNFLTGGR